MTGRSLIRRYSTFVFGFLVIAVAGRRAIAGNPSGAATSAFNTYVAQVEARFDRQHKSGGAFLVPEDRARLLGGKQIIEQVTPPEDTDLPGAMLHHWRGTAFAPGAKAADFERLMKDFRGYPRRYAPQVERALVIGQKDDHFKVTMRTQQKHVITVVMDTDYDVTFGRLDANRGYSLSRSTRISEIESPGTKKERALGPDEDHGFLWRLNTYWSYEERDGGLYMQIESVSLSRSVPPGLAWAVKPFVESVPRESLEFTLRATCDAMGKQNNAGTTR